MVRLGKVRRIRKVRSRSYGHVVRSGIGFGSALAMVISYAKSASILWAIFHGILGWIYVLYFVIRFRLL